MAAMIGGSILVLALPLDRCSKAGTTGYKWEQVGGTGDVGLLNGRTCSSTVIIDWSGAPMPRLPHPLGSRALHRVRLSTEYIAALFGPTEVSMRKIIC